MKPTLFWLAMSTASIFPFFADGALEVALPLPAKQATQAYKVTVKDNHDADTIRCDIMIGFGLMMTDQTFRLYRINAWEVTGAEKPKGEIARDRVKGLLAKGKEILFVPVPYSSDRNTFQKEKFGRWLGELYIDGVNINDLLVKEGHAKYQKY